MLSVLVSPAKAFIRSVQQLNAASPARLCETLHAIAQALDATPDWFFTRRSGAGPVERDCVIRAQNRRNLNTLYGQDAGDLGYGDQLLSSSIGGNFHMGLAIYAPFSERSEHPLQDQNGEEQGLVLEAKLEMQIGYERIIYRTGDRYSFDARLPRHGRIQNDRVFRVVRAVTPVVIPKDVAPPAHHKKKDDRPRMSRNPLL